MRRRILVAILSVTTIAVVLFGVPLAIVVERFVDDDALLRVERQAVLAARDVHSDFVNDPDPIEFPHRNDVALALYDLSGSLAAGDGPSTADEVTRQALADHVADAEADGRFIVAVPVSDDESVVGAIRAEQPTAATTARATRIIAALIGLAIVVIAIGAAIGYIVAGRLARPVRRLRDAAIQLGDGNFALRVPRSNVPELDEAAAAMTTTAKRLDALVSAERAFSADASHQLRTPLTALRAAIETEQNFPRPDRADILSDALDDIDRLERTIDDLLDIARSSDTDHSTASISQALTELASAWRGRFASAGRPLLIADATDVPPISGNGMMLQQALDVLVDNALVHGAGTTSVSTRVGPDTVTISVTDEGAGFPEDTQSERTAGANHGLGLPLAGRLVAGMRGRLTTPRLRPRPQVDVVLRRTDAEQPSDY